MSDDHRIRETIDALLDARAPSATLCPSEVARALAPAAWRGWMPRVREVALAMAQAGVIDIRQRGLNVDPSKPPRGPIRLGRPAATPSDHRHPVTPDGRYFVVRGRLWRMANPHLPAAERAGLVQRLMDARRALRRSAAAPDRQALRDEVDRVKRALGERGPVWWDDGSPDFNRRLARNTPYADWYASVPAATEKG